GANCTLTVLIERSRNAGGEATGEGFLLAVSSAVVGSSAPSSVVLTIGNGGSASVKCAQDHYLNVKFPHTVNGITNDVGGSLSRDGVVAPVFPVPCVAPGVAPWVSNLAVAIHPADAGTTSVIQAATINGQVRIY